MTEIKEKLLEGDESDRSSDRRLENVTSSQMDQVYGLNGRVIEPKPEDLFKPHPIVPLFTSKTERSQSPVDVVKKYSHKDSGLALSILDTRNSKKTT